MKNAVKLAVVTITLAALAQTSVFGQDKPAPPKASTSTPAPTSAGGLETTKDKVSYSIGMQWGGMLKRSGYEVDTDKIMLAIKDVLQGNEPKLTEPQAREVMTAYSKEMNTKREEERKKAADKNKKESADFLEQNKSKAGVKTKSVTMPDGTTAEFQYKVLAEGTGATPGSNDTVTVNYRGTLINGKEFDSSAKHSGPFKTKLNQVVRGWTEALQMMKVGSKWELYLPSSLAYGDFGKPPEIEPGSALIFEMELVSSEATPPPAPPQPLTSDIIRVPSADELKKGAKIEVLKPEDVERQTRAATNSAAKPK
jgi:FKBP-type peptidyl-prolyl cis-trans isomerase FklB